MRFLVYAIGCLALATPLPAIAAVFIVDSTVDAADANPGDGICASAADGCTLGAALMETNALQGRDVIQVPPGISRPTSVVSDDVEIAGTG